MQSTAALGKWGRKNASMNIDPDNDDFSVRGFTYDSCPSCHDGSAFFRQ